MTYVTLDRAKRHLNYSAGAHDDNETIFEKVEEASAIIADYLGSNADEDWDETTAPAIVQSATLLMLTHLFEHRGDDMAPDEAMWMAIKRLLMRYRDPVVA